jgi:uncharacterized protein YneF (UPF0154 family)
MRTFLSVLAIVLITLVILAGGTFFVCLCLATRNETLAIFVGLLALVVAIVVPLRVSRAFFRKSKNENQIR